MFEDCVVGDDNMIGINIGENGVLKFDAWRRHFSILYLLVVPSELCIDAIFAFTLIAAVGILFDGCIFPNRITPLHL